MIKYSNNDINFVADNFTFSELLFSFKKGIIDEIFLKKLFDGNDYIGDVVDNLYKMSFLENEDYDILYKRSLYLYLKYLSNTCKNEEELKYNVDYICDFFQYPNEVKHLIYYIPSGKEVVNNHKDWILKDELFIYLNKYKTLLKLPDCNIPNELEELCSNNFALVSSGKYKNYLITCKKEISNIILVNIWPSYIVQNEHSYEFSFNNLDNFFSFIAYNNIHIYKCISNDFFIDEDNYLSSFRVAFDKKIE